MLCILYRHFTYTTFTDKDIETIFFFLIALVYIIFGRVGILNARFEHSKSATTATIKIEPKKIVYLWLSLCIGFFSINKINIAVFRFEFELT